MLRNTFRSAEWYDLCIWKCYKEGRCRIFCPFHGSHWEHGMNDSIFSCPFKRKKILRIDYKYLLNLILPSIKESVVVAITIKDRLRVCVLRWRHGAFVHLAVRLVGLNTWIGWFTIIWSWCAPYRHCRCRCVGDW